ncbi:DUF2341 domain-containing protein [Candidatus Nanosalina sp. VS9-1]|uniref:DUF2341 domain-containing protein n=1 Tax=Candidatus Nanosalina sp. VS9-1 TaxID=3388566 RepID=UPI0039DFD049
MSSKIRNKSRELVFLAVILLVVPLSFATVTLTSDTIIEQTGNDAEIVVQEDFNVSQLSVYDNATEFGQTNFSLPHTGSNLIQANMTKFNGSVNEGEILTDFKANASSGETLTIDLANLTRRMYYRVYVDGLGYANRSSGDQGDYSYSLDYNSNEFKDIYIKAEAQDTISHSASFTDGLTYSPNTSMNVLGSGQYKISNDAVSGANVSIYRDGSFIESVTTDQNGEYSPNLVSPKIAGTHSYDLNMSQHHLFDNVDREVTVDSLFIENPNVTSLNRDSRYIDIDEEAALNISAKVYRNKENPIDSVTYTIHDDPSSPPITSTFESWASLKNTSAKTETQTWYNTTPALSDKEGFGDLGNYTIRFRASSTLNGETINIEDNPEFNITIQDVDMNLELDESSYSTNNDDYVNISGRVIRQPDGEVLNNTDVDLRIYDNETGDNFQVATVTTNETGHYSYDYNFVDENGVRKVEATAEDSKGIGGNESKIFTVTELSIDSIEYSDSYERHEYNISALVSDSRGISNHECSLTVSDSSGNSVDYNMSLDNNTGNSNTAYCRQPYINYENSSNWSATEDLTAEIRVENGSTYATSTSSRALPNTDPQTGSFTVDEIEKKYAADVQAVAEDPNEGSDEIEACTVYYYNEAGEEYSVEGNLDTSYGATDEASCSYTVDSSLEGLSSGENVDIAVSFMDKHGGTGMTSNKTATLQATLTFEGDVRTLNGSAPSTTIEFYDPGTSNVVTSLQDDNGDVTGTVAKGTYDMNVITKYGEVEFNRAEITNDTSFLLEVEPKITEQYDDGIPEQWAREESHIAVSDIDVAYDNATVRMDYSGLDEGYIAPWTCKEWNEDPNYRACQEETFPYDQLEYSPADNYDLDTGNNMVEIGTSNSEGAYVLASNRGWRTDWFWRKEITIEGGQKDLENYQVKISVNTKEYILNENLDSSCNNLRFYNTDQTKQVDYWMEPGTCNTQNTVFWVEMPYIPANSDRTIFMYYERDKDLASASSGEETFLAFDEFDTNSSSNYETAGLTRIEDDRLRVRSQDGEEASVRYTDKNFESPYRTHSRVRADGSSDRATVSTYLDSADAVSYNINEGLFKESFTDASSSHTIDTSDWIDVTQTVTSGEQTVNVEPAGESLSISGNLSSGSYSPFGASINDSSDTLSTLDVERWFTTKYASSEPTVRSINTEKLWELSLNGSSRDVNVPLDSVVNIELNSSDYKSPVIIYKNDSVIAESDGGVEGIFYRESNLNERASYPIRAEIDEFNETIIYDITVGQDDLSPNVSLQNQERIGTNKMNFSYEVKDNYQGSVECSLAIDGDVKAQSRVDLDLDKTWYSSSFYTEDAPHGANSYNISCTDNSNNTASYIGQYDQDFKAPEIEFTNLEDGQDIWQYKPQVKLNIVDTHSEEIDYNVYYAYDEDMNTANTTSNNTVETVRLPTTTRWGLVDFVVEAEDDKNQSRTKSITVDLNEPYVDLISPAEGNDEKRVQHNPSEPGNREVLPETRVQRQDPNVVFEFNYTDQIQDSTQCRLMVDGTEKANGTYATNTPGTFDVTLDQGINQEAHVECENEVGNYISSTTRHLDIDSNDPSVEAVIFEQGNNTAYTETKEHEVDIRISDNLMAPATSQSFSGRSRYGSCNKGTSTEQYPFLEINGTDNAISMSHNFDGATKNETVQLERESYVYGIASLPTLFSGCSYNTATEPLDYVTENFGNLGAGEYNFEMWVQDETGNSISTKQYTYTVAKGDPGISLSSDNDRASNNEIIRDSSPEIRCSASTDQVSTTLLRNGLEVDSATNGEDVLQDNTNLPEGTYTYKCETAGNENFSQSSSTRTIDVVKYLPDEVKISMNGEFVNKTVEYGTPVELDITSRSGNDNSELVVDGQTVTAPHTVNYETGNYTVFGNASGSYRFNASNTTRELEVIRTSNNVNLTSNETINTVEKESLSQFSYGNYDVRIMNIVEGQTPQITCESDTASSTTNITRYGTVVYEGTGTDSNILDAADVGAGFYRYSCKTSTTKNYNSASDGIYVDIQEAPEPDYVTGTDGSDGFDFTSGETEKNIEIGTTVDVTCDTEQDVPTTLYYEGDVVSSPDTRTFDQTGNYNYTCATESTDNFRASQRTIIYDVMNRTSTDLYLNGGQTDITVDQNEEVEIIGEVNVSGTEVELRDGRTRDTRFWVGTDGRAEKNHTFSIPGEHKITALHPEEDDYFRSSDSATVTVNDVTAPEISLDSPADESITRDNDINIIYNARDYSQFTCSLEINDTVVDERTNSGGDRYRWERAVIDINRPSGVYDYQVNCKDEHGNTRSSDTREFRLDTEDPNIQINEDALVETGDPSPSINVTTSDVSSREVNVEFYANATVDDENLNYWEEPHLEGGQKIADSTGPADTTRQIETDQLEPGLYKISARVVDEVGNDYYIANDTDLRVFDNITIMEPGNNEGEEYVNTTDPELSFKYYSDDAPLTCEVAIDGTTYDSFTEGEDTWINNTATELGVDTGLSQGSHTWAVTCGTSNSDTFTFDKNFYVDVQEPEIEWTHVSQPSGSSYTGDSITYSTEVSDNFEIDTVTVEAASDYQKVQMYCGNDNVCTADLNLEPGQHHYNYTVCDKAGNCFSTDTTEYTIVDESESMNLYLNGQQDNITITEDPVVNMTGEFVQPKEGTVYFYVNDSLEARCDRGTGCTAEENFLTPNGTYEITAEFYSFTDSTTNIETYYVNAQVPESEFEGYKLRNLAPGKEASLDNNPVQSILGLGLQNNKNVLLGNDVGQDLAAQLNIDFSSNIDAADMIFDTDRSAGKSFIHLERDYSRVVRKDLLVPRIEDTGKVRVCPGAQSLAAVTPTCNNGYNISTGETVGSVTMSEVTINGQDYYEVRGITGTGGEEIGTTSTDDSLNEPAEAEVTNSETLDEWGPYTPTESSIDLDGGNVTSGNLSSKQSTDNWAGLYGNATGDLVLGGESTLYRWDAEPSVVLAANATVTWSNLTEATATEIDEYYDIGDGSDNTEATMDTATTITIGNTTFDPVRSVKTFNGSGVPTWTTGALSDGEVPVFAGKARTNQTTAFNGEIANYQMMIPTGGDRILGYSMYMDIK